MAPVSGDEDEDIAAPGDPDDVDDVTGDEVAAARDASGGHAEDVDDIANDQDPEDYNGNSHRPEVRKSAETGVVTDNFWKILFKLDIKLITR